MQGQSRRSAGERLMARVFVRLAHFSFLLMRPMTLGVRAVVIDAEGRALLVKHTYVAGWHLPGGGVEVGETCEAALTRELAEEANVVLEGPAPCSGCFSIAMCRGAIMSRSMSRGAFASRGSARPTEKSSRRGSSPPTRCRPIRRAARGRASPRRSSGAPVSPLW